MALTGSEEFTLAYATSRQRFQLFTLLVRTVGIIIVTWLIVDGLKFIATSAPDQIGALAKVVDALRLYDVFPWCASCIAGTAWYHERKGKKRAISEKSRLQKIIESDDPDRMTCGLTETGDTPED